MVIGSGTIRQHTRHFLLVVHCHYIAISHHFGDISTCIAHVITSDLQLSFSSVMITKLRIQYMLIIR